MSAIEIESMTRVFEPRGRPRVVATVRFRARGRGSGIEVDGRLYDVFTLRDGKIVRMDQFTEQSEALEAVGLRE